MLLAACLLPFYIMQTFNSVPPPHRNWWGCWVTAARRCTVTAANTSFDMSASVSHSLENTKEYNVFDSFSTETRQLLQSAFFLCPVKMEDILYKDDYFLSDWLDYFLSLCHVFQPPSNNIFYISVFHPLFTFSCSSAIPALNHDYNASSRPSSAVHSAFLFIPFCTLACWGCHSTVSDPCL